ncbi:MAG: chorismate lyase [Gammaproteobacteria bacterium]|nr:chorismate lyase [Gammaproteobacteria bacterium]
MYKSPLTSDMTINKWLSMAEFRKTQPQESQYRWLSEYGSMTLHLLQAGLGSLKVSVMSSQQGALFKEESLFLDLPLRRWAYVREVMMHVDLSPWMYGRTVIPDTTLNGGAGQLKLLGDSPLGKVLFDNKKSTREFIEIAKISAHHHLFPQLVDVEVYPYLWARRSLFSFNEQPILVQEVFLPDCPLKMPG